MKRTLLPLLLFPLLAFSQKLKPEADVNTVFVCLNSATYSKLFEQPFVKDTLFACRETSTSTNAENYTGKYFFGLAGTLEFFRPVKTKEVGDKYGDLGIEFKTRQLNTLELYARHARENRINISIDPITYEAEGKKIRWYDELKVKFDTVPDRFSVSVLEYQREYLALIGFTPEAIAAPMAYDQVNKKLFKGRKYSRQFNSIRKISVTINRHELAYLEQVMNMMGFINKGTSFTGGGFTIDYTVTEEKKFRLSSVEVDLIDNLPHRIIPVSDNLLLEVTGDKATLSFKY